MKKFWKRIKRLGGINHVTSNRIVYVALLIALGFFAFTSGERVLYVTVGVMLAMPVVSLVFTFLALGYLTIKQSVPSTILKNQEGVLVVRLHNHSFMPFTNVECQFFSNEYAIQTWEEPDFKFTMRPFVTVQHEIPFEAMYRGRYKVGIHRVQVTDFMGLFTLHRKYEAHNEVIVLPRILDFANIPLAINVIAETSSRFDIRDEDYSTIADIRSYMPTDSIKRVHWKLTAKRSEWLVKIFQSNALNCISIVLDSRRLDLPLEDMYFLEDQMVECTLGLGRYCLKNAMPVDLIVTDGRKIRAQTMSGLDSIYNLLSAVDFEEKPALDPVSVLTHVLNDSTSYVNAVICTATLDIHLYERFVHAINKGNYAAIVYFATPEPDPEHERIFSLMEEGGLPCFRITQEVMFDVA